MSYSDFIWNRQNCEFAVGCWIVLYNRRTCLKRWHVVNLAGRSTVIALNNLSCLCKVIV